MAVEIDPLHLEIGNLQVCRIMFGDEAASDLETCLGRGRSKERDHHLLAFQGLAGPVFADRAEQPVLNRVPLGSPGRKMAHGHFQSKPVGDLLL